MIRRLFPHPVLSALVFLVWMAMVSRFAVGSLVFAALLGVIIPLVAAPYWSGAVGMRRPLRFAGFALLVLYDIVMANISVARIVLFMPKSRIRPAWVSVPLGLTNPQAITMLASVITLTPGTLSCDLSDDHGALLVHCLHAPDPADVVAEIKTRYEAPIKELFG